MKNSIIILILFFASCNAEKRCHRSMHKAIAGGCLNIDTVYHYDTIRGWQYDTTFIGDTVRNIDTFTVFKNGIEVKTLVRWKERVITQQVTKSDTIIKYKEITKRLKEVTKRCVHWKYWVAIIFLGTCLIGALFKKK